MIRSQRDAVGKVQFDSLVELSKLLPFLVTCPSAPDRIGYFAVVTVFVKLHSLQDVRSLPDFDASICDYREYRFAVAAFRIIEAFCQTDDVFGHFLRLG